MTRPGKRANSSDTMTYWGNISFSFFIFICGASSSLCAHRLHPNTTPGKRLSSSGRNVTPFVPLLCIYIYMRIFLRRADMHGDMDLGGTVLSSYIQQGGQCEGNCFEGDLWYISGGFTLRDTCTIFHQVCPTSGRSRNLKGGGWFR